MLAWRLQIIQDVNQVHRYRGQKRDTKEDLIIFRCKELFHLWRNRYGECSSLGIPRSAPSIRWKGFATHSEPLRILTQCPRFCHFCFFLRSTKLCHACGWGGRVLLPVTSLVAEQTRGCHDPTPLSLNYSPEAECGSLGGILSSGRPGSEVTISRLSTGQSTVYQRVRKYSSELAQVFERNGTKSRKWLTCDVNQGISAL